MDEAESLDRAVAPSQRKEPGSRKDHTPRPYHRENADGSASRGTSPARRANKTVNEQNHDAPTDLDAASMAPFVDDSMESPSALPSAHQADTSTVGIKHSKNRKLERGKLIEMIQKLTTQWAQDHDDDPEKLWRAVIKSQVTRWRRAPSAWDIYYKRTYDTARRAVESQRIENGQ